MLTLSVCATNEMAFVWISFYLIIIKALEKCRRCILQIDNDIFCIVNPTIRSAIICVALKSVSFLIKNKVQMKKLNNIGANMDP